MRILKTAQGKQSERNENNEDGAIAGLQTQWLRDRSGSGLGAEPEGQPEGEAKGAEHAKDQAYKGTG